MIKKLIGGLLALAAVIVIGVFFLGSNLDGLIKRAIEDVGTQAAKAPTTLERVELSVSSGKAALHGFKLGNPEGFSSEGAMKFSLVSVEVDPQSIMGTGPIVIKSVVIDAPEMNYEVKKDNSSNFESIQKNIKTFATSLNAENTEAAQSGETKKEEVAREGRKIIVEKLTISNGQVKLAHELLAQANMVNVKLPTIEMTNIGKNSAGITAAELTQQILQKITGKAMEIGQARIVQELSKQSMESLKGAIDQSNVGKALGGLLGN